MKRNEHLQPLSRQHHNGLLAALLVNKGLKKEADKQVIADFILHAWNRDIRAHFALEEEVLIPALQHTALEPALTAQLLDEHKTIRALVEKFESSNFDRETLSAFAGLLEKHIRFEERTYFPRAEAVLTQKELEAIGAALGEETDWNCMHYPIKFWE